MRRTSMRASRWRRTQILVLMLATASPAFADPGRPTSNSAAETDSPARSPVKATWADVVTLVERHPRLAAAELEIEAARNGVDAAGAVPNPVVEGTLGQGVARTDGTARVEWSLALTIPLGWIAAREARIGAAQAEADVAAADAELLRRDVLLQLRSLFWNLAYAQSRVASLESLDAQTLALVETIARRVEKGEARPVESTRVEIELEKVQSELDAARTALGARRAELALWLGLPATKSIVAVADVDSVPVVLDRAAALSAARTSHPSLAVAKARDRALEAELETEKLARVPAFSLTGFTDFELDRRAYGVGFAVDLPLWNWNSGRIARAEARLAAGRKQAEAAGLEIQAAVLDAQAACQASAATATRFKNNVVPRSEAAASTMERTYQLGEAGLLDVIDARRTLLDARRLYLNALVQAQTDCSRLRALVGKESR